VNWERDMSPVENMRAAKAARLADATSMIVRRVGRWLRAERVRIAELEVDVKQHGDFVSRADRTADQMLRDDLTTILPGSDVLSEENKELAGEGEWRWIVDPLDGTSNYLAGLPYWGISVALEDVSERGRSAFGDLLLGLVYLPELDRMYIARAGSGASVNGHPIEVRERSLDRHTYSHWWPMDSGQPLETFQEIVSKLHPKVGAIRNLGSPAAELCLVADGTLQGFFATDMEPWDLAAGILLVEEAGGFVADPWNGNPMESGFAIAGTRGAMDLLRRELGNRFPRPGAGGE